MVIGADDDWHGTVSGSLGAIMQNFKSVTTRKIRAAGLVTSARVFQRNYWERLIRTERELQAVREYIAHNPVKWSSVVVGV